MKRAIIILISSFMVFMLASCGDNSGDSSPNSSANSASVSSNFIIPEYISDYDVQYNEKDEQFLLSFGFQDKNNKYVTSYGKADIVIKDKSKNVLYEKTVSFDENDFGEYTSKLWDGTRLLAGIYIDVADIKPATSFDGVLSVKIEAADGFATFDKRNLDIYGLPEKEIEIKASKLPCDVKYVGFDGSTSVIRIKSIDVKSEILLNDAYADIDVVAEIISYNPSSYYDGITVKYSLKDSQGVKVQTDKEYLDDVEQGDSVKFTINLYDLDPNESYTISFMDEDDSIDYSF